ncbi:hypothetical protein BJX63DRAFT_387385 [Aspergillus granulosus]|uniref:Uncharacterized protein n=1 Tax=Aspergillus granulosus TaxID=176169 RepID=A0ABR4HLV4_9EURO
MARLSCAQSINPLPCSSSVLTLSSSSSLWSNCVFRRRRPEFGGPYNYFVHSGGHPCPPTANRAEWMLEVIGTTPGSHTDINWFNTWSKSPEYALVQEHLTELKLGRSQLVDLNRT